MPATALHPVAGQAATSHPPTSRTPRSSSTPTPSSSGRHDPRAVSRHAVGPWGLHQRPRRLVLGGHRELDALDGGSSVHGPRRLSLWFHDRRVAAPRLLRLRRLRCLVELHQHGAMICPTYITQQVPPPAGGPELLGRAGRRRRRPDRGPSVRTRADFAAHDVFWDYRQGAAFAELVDW